MKTIFFCLSLLNLVHAQEVTIPSEIDSVFKYSFSHALNTSWQRDGDDYSVTFMVSNGQSVHIIYDTLGHMKEKYMAIPFTHIPATITSYVKSTYPDVSVKNYWVKQKGIERIYKIELHNGIVGAGTISGSAYGVTARNDTNGEASFHNSEGNTEDSASSLYFDRFGNPISSKDALSGVYIAKQKAVEKPSHRPTYQTGNSKKGQSGKSYKKR